MPAISINPANHGARRRSLFPLLGADMISYKK
jgi:hypothetical protein